MRQSVLDAFFGFSAKFEGSCNFPYCDVLGLVTTGVGNLIDPIETAIALPWTILLLRPASPDEIREGWLAVKARKDLTQHGGMAYKNISHLRLSQDAIVDLVDQRMASNEAELLHYFPTFADFPAPAQMGIMSIAWACGAGFPETFVNFKRAANSGDWVAAAAQSHVSNGAPARNDANHYLFLAAACTVADGSDYDVLHWPQPPFAA